MELRWMALSGEGRNLSQLDMVGYTIISFSSYFSTWWCSGIQKLQIICVIEDEKVSVDDLIDKITGDFESHVCSSYSILVPFQNRMY